MLSFLIIDDSEIIRSLLSEYLTDLGHQVECAVDGQLGLDLALAKEYNIIFCDIHMPKKNGYLVLKEVIKQKPGTNFIMTDSLPDELAEKAKKAGAFCILTKPFDLNEVDEIIDKIISKVSV